MKKILPLFFSLVALVSCCDNSTTIDRFNCQENQYQSTLLWNDFLIGAFILLGVVLGLVPIFNIIYKIKNKNKSFDEYIFDYSWVFICIWIVVTIMWAVAVWLLNGGALLKYIGIA